MNFVIGSISNHAFKWNL